VFPVRRIYCIGRNYAAHAREMGSDPNREPPFFFQKPTDAIQNVAIDAVGDHPYPSLTKNYHYEVELVAALKSGGTNIPAEQALDHVYGYALGLDMTRRDLQRAMGDEKKPWEIGKSFDRSAVLGPIHPAAKTGHFTKGAISLAVNGSGQAELGPAEHDLERRRADLKIVGSLRTQGRRHHLFRHPENVGPVVKGTCCCASSMACRICRSGLREGGRHSGARVSANLRCAIAHGESRDSQVRNCAPVRRLRRPE
jgi:2-keto-4-pentenoate hydratase/2-oxohepta-3-ene-1,7-dioic acid hydratase in catechol pathway